MSLRFKQELKNHLRDIIESYKDSPLPPEVALEAQTDALAKVFTVFVKSLEIDTEHPGDILDHFTAEIYDSKTEAFYYGHNEALDLIVFHLE